MASGLTGLLIEDFLASCELRAIIVPAFAILGDLKDEFGQH